MQNEWSDKEQTCSFFLQFLFFVFMSSFLTCYIGNYKTEVKEQGSSHNSESALQLITRCVNMFHFLQQIMMRHPTKHHVDSKKKKQRKKEKKKKTKTPFPDLKLTYSNSMKLFDQSLLQILPKLHLNAMSCVLTFYCENHSIL